MHADRFETLAQARAQLASALIACVRTDTNTESGLADALAEFSRVEERIPNTHRPAYRAYRFGTEAILNHVRHARAVRNAEPASDRFRMAALALAGDAENAVRAGEVLDPNWAAALGAIGAVTASGGTTEAARALLRVSLPVLTHSELLARPDAQRSTSTTMPRDPTKEVSLVVATVRLNGVQTEAGDEVYLEPEIAHDLSAELVVGKWPAGTSAFILEPLQVEDREVLSTPSLTFAPSGDANAPVVATGRLVVRSAQAFMARPYSVAYQGRFEPEAPGFQVDVRGGSLRIRSHDPKRNPITGYTEADDAVYAVRDLARRLTPPCHDDDLLSFLTMVSRLAGIAGAALQGHYFKSPISEAQFQRDALLMLRAQRDIGADLIEAGKTAGGIMDLSFHGIPVELKVEASKVLSVEDASTYFGQTRQYAAGNGKRLAVVAVLDCAEKESPPPGLGNDIAFRIVSPSSGSRPFGLGIVIIRGNLPAPSEHSR